MRYGRSLAPGRAKDGGDLVIAARLGVRERRNPVTVADAGIGASLDQRTHRLGMGGAAVAQHHGFDQRGPAEIVYMVEGRTRDDQPSHHLGMAKLGRGNQRGPVPVASRQLP